MNKKSNRFSPEVRQRAVRMVQEHRGEYSSLWACIESIAPKIGCVAQTLSDWVKRHEIDEGTRDGISSNVSQIAPPYYGRPPSVVAFIWCSSRTNNSYPLISKLPALTNSISPGE